jgi:hypothetical protein
MLSRYCDDEDDDEIKIASVFSRLTRAHTERLPSCNSTRSCERDTGREQQRQLRSDDEFSSLRGIKI